MYVCLECGHVFDDDFSVWTEPHGERRCGCPSCRGEFEEAVECEICGGYFADSDLNSGVCEFCIEDLGNNLEVCYEISKDEKEDIKINAFLAAVLSAEEIEEVLIDYLKNNKPNIDCKGFINQDIGWFAEKLKEVDI